MQNKGILFYSIHFGVVWSCFVVVLFLFFNAGLVLVIKYFHSVILLLLGVDQESNLLYLQVIMM